MSVVKPVLMRSTRETGRRLSDSEQELLALATSFEIPDTMKASMNDLKEKLESSKRYERNRHGIRFMSRLEALWQLRRRILDVVPSEQDEETYFDNASDSTLKSIISKLGNALPSIILNCATPAFWWGFSENGATLLGVWLHGWPSLENLESIMSDSRLPFRKRRETLQEAASAVKVKAPDSSITKTTTSTQLRAVVGRLTVNVRLSLGNRTCGVFESNIDRSTRNSVTLCL